MADFLQTRRMLAREDVFLTVKFAEQMKWMVFSLPSGTVDIGYQSKYYRKEVSRNLNPWQGRAVNYGLAGQSLFY